MSTIEGFSTRLREARLAANLTQEQLGFAVDVTKSSVSAWENGREMPGLRNLPKLRAALGCSLDYLVCGTPFQFVDSQFINEKPNHITAKDPQEAGILELFRGLSSKQKKALAEVLRR